MPAIRPGKLDEPFLCVCEDEEDDLMLATAVAGNADFLVTGDKYLQTLGSYRNITILSPRQFLDLFDLEASRTT